MRPLRGSSIVVLVLMASTVVAVVLAVHALRASRQREAISTAMQRQYAQLATWEYSRKVRQRVEDALMQTLLDHAHPERIPAHGRAETGCTCLAVDSVERWLGVPPSGDAAGEAAPLRTAIAAALTAGPALGREGMSEGVITMIAVPDDPARFVALKPEPHLRPDGGWVGLVTSYAALEPLLERAHLESPLLPEWLTTARGPMSSVHVVVRDGAGTALYTSPGTTAGPVDVEAPIWPDGRVALSTRVSMPPEFVAGLGPEHGASTGVGVIWTLIAANVVLVGVGLRQIRKERDLARLRATFVAGVSHEMRTPLAQIRMFSDMLALDRVRNDEERQRALRIIGQESTRLSHLVDNVLQFHRGAGPATVHPAAVLDLSAFVAEVASSFEPLAAARNVRLVCTPVATRVPVKADHGALRQVVLNILDNAVKYGPAGQTVVLSITSDADYAVLTVDDQGSGIPAGDRTRMFEAFTRGRDTRGTGGAGIGLAVVRDIVLAHGGRVALEDSPAGGTRVIVTLPLATGHD